MKTLGLIGGMSWESSAIYYQLINRAVAERLGGLHSANCMLYSVDFHIIEQLQSRGEWPQAGEQLARIGLLLETAGADCLILCTNTMHKVFSAIEQAVSIPVLHIADVTATAITDAGLTKVGLFGTRFTMEEDFFKERTESKANIEIRVPTPEEQRSIDRIIYTELCHGKILAESKAKLIEIADRMHHGGIDGLILGCTELGLLLNDQDTPLQLFDTTRLHAAAAVNWCLA